MQGFLHALDEKRGLTVKTQQEYLEFINLIR